MYKRIRTMHVALLLFAILTLGNLIKITIKSDCSISYSAKVICNHQLKIESQEITNTKFKREKDMAKRFIQTDDVWEKSRLVLDFVANIIYNSYNGIGGVLYKRLFIRQINTWHCRTIRTMHVALLLFAILTLGNLIKITIKSDCSISPFF